MNRLLKILPFVIIASAVVIAVLSVWDDSPIVDEIPHIGAGYSYIIKGDMRLNPEHPPLAKDLAGIALSFLGLKQTAFNTHFWLTDINGQWEFGRNLLFNSGNDAIKAVHAAKMPVLIFFILSGILVYIWTKKLYGNKAALLALFLFSFSPTVIAHSRFVTTDVPALFGVLVSSFFFVRYLKSPTRRNLIIAGLALGIATLTKFSMFLLVPYFLALAVIYGFVSGRNTVMGKLSYLLNTVLIIFIGYIFVVGPVYALHVRNYPPERQKQDTTYNVGSYGRRFFPNIVIWMSDKPVIRPLAQYGVGLLMVTQRSIGGNDTYFLGEVSKNAWKKYFPIVYFLKEPLPFWILISLVWLYWSAKFQFKKNLLKNILLKSGAWTRDYFTEFAMLLWLVIYWYASIKANLNIGVRHLLPIYGFTYILLSGQVIKISHKIYSKKMLIVYCSFVGILLGWYLYENLSVYPYYLTYFNQVAGGPSGGYRYVVDSNLDWGQDAKRLAEWIDKNNIPKIHLDYFGWADAGYYLKNKYIWLTRTQYNSAAEFLKDEPHGGYIAISASFFQGSQGNSETGYSWLNEYAPITVIGNSIFVWYIPPRE